MIARFRVQANCVARIGNTISVRIYGVPLAVEKLDFRQIDRALEKIEEGTYGVCDISGEEIPLKRLEAIPYAAMTVAAQEKMEKGLL